MELVIGITAKWDKGAVDDRPNILSAMNEKNRVDVEDKFYGNRQSVLEFFKTIKDENNPTFQFEWNPPDKYKSTFLNLKGERKKFEISFRVFIKENGTPRWTTTATADGAKVTNVVGNGRGNATQKVDIKCDKFDYKPGEDMNINVP